jgi:cytochrome c biogenesis protein CcmG/thiol:disulfide interchange protein DsbE
VPFPRVAVSLAFWALVGAAQPLPDARMLYERTQATAKRFHSLQFFLDLSLEAGSPFAPIHMTAEMAYVSPGKTRIDTKTMGVSILDVSDGETTWIYNSAAKQYAKTRAAQGLAAVAAAMGLKIPDASSIHPSYQATSEETIEIDGHKHECWVLEMRVAKFTGISIEDVPPSKMIDTVMTSWIDKKLGIDVQSTLDTKMQIGNTEVPMHQKLVKKRIQIDQPVDPALFSFTPPSGAKEVERLNLFASFPAMTDLAGKPAPAFELESIGGQAFSLAALKGKPVLLDFWATWCAPCRRSVPVLEKLSLESKNTDLVILGVNIEEDRKSVEEFLRKTPFRYPAVLSGESGILEAYQVTSYPTFILIGRDGKIVAHEIGFGGENQLRKMIDKAGLKVP